MLNSTLKTVLKSLLKSSAVTALALCAGGLSAHAADMGRLTVVIENAQAGQGPLYVSVQSRDNYMKWDGESGSIYEDITGGTLVYTYDDLPEGEYAVSVWHDTNNDNSFTMDANFIPQDGWGNSGAGEPKGQPSFDDVKVLVTARGTTANVQMVYPD